MSEKHTCIERTKSSPLKVLLCRSDHCSYRNNASLLAVPHIGRPSSSSRPKISQKSHQECLLFCSSSEGADDRLRLQPRSCSQQCPLQWESLVVARFIAVFTRVGVERKNIRVIENSSGETRRANSHENRNKVDRVHHTPILDEPVEPHHVRVSSCPR